MAAPDSLPKQLGDEAELYRTYNDTLMRQVARRVDTSSPEVIEDACSFAWAQFLRYQPDRSRNWKSWLIRTAQREAWLLEAKVRGHKALRSFEWEDQSLTVEVGGEDTVERHYHAQDALELIAGLRPRLQPIAFLRALGLGHAEIGSITGDSPLRVSQLIAEANQTIGDVLAARREGVETASPRARRLWELETEQPPWLTAHIGRLPRASRKLAGQTETRRAWRRAAIALEDYRSALGVDHLDAALAAPPSNPAFRRHYDTAQRALEQLTQLKERSSRRGLCD